MTQDFEIHPTELMLAIIKGMNQQLQELVFHHPGVMVSEDQVNLLVSSVRQPSSGTISIKLMCLDPSQFKPAK